MKPCIRCAQVKPLQSFYRHPQMADGHLNKCKACCKEYASHHYRELSGDAEFIEKERERGREKYHRLYGTGPNWKSPDAPAEQKKLARQALAHAVRSGQVLRGVRCEDCGDTSRRLHGHHEDYFQPLAVAWVCPTCHRRRHAAHPDRVKPSPGPEGIQHDPLPPPSRPERRRWGRKPKRRPRYDFDPNEPQERESQ